MEIKFKPSSLVKLSEYEKLYKLCFPNAHHLKQPYLTWLYKDNPVGEAIGFDAIFENRVVGHVISIPTKFFLHGKEEVGVLSLNTAVHPDFQGRKLFAKLGVALWEHVRSLGYTFVMGVANASSTHGFIKHMGFQNVCPLLVKIGYGKINADLVLDKYDFIHAWNEKSLLWRINNPINQVHLGINTKSSILSAAASTNKAGIFVAGEIIVQSSMEELLKTSSFKMPKTIMPNLFIGLIPNYKFKLGYFNIPEFIKPSPLNFIYKNLVDEKDKLDPQKCFINFLDFDAF